MKKLMTIVVILVGFVMASTGSAAPPDAKLYNATISGKVELGKDGKLTLQIVPAKGYKWNEQYPTKLVVSEASKLSFTKKTFGKSDFSVKGANGVVDMTARGESAGSGRLDAEISFSICNEETCKLLRKKKISLPVTVAGPAAPKAP